ncbi:uncharacterized protein MONOS_1218 [Monocercomonoides exilis]|uniref:uncharacterized protein n=1 Tax=Monocercomonoides exilis TaxID=2049356 RepID=UPI00355AC905|nr:hypothetical protein MONOS_1218 [Monocercomonoides exilis]|eukprot:MONOS_1218.1-p1 / transcript=MONOS_1218.1 / gene=MONOS_1218 / organism=Monocercomonoides_exilis_PA203 / gene_product=unspecified product / transcript_product=unspecified product / location=Mono_scaffold00020:236803-239751(+) / protein_length=983 / sequence_SO=supercontig / SO=protein_coding / is_pseudo=false
MCKGTTSDGAGFREESVKVENMNYPEGAWPEKAQSNKCGDYILFDECIKGKEEGERETSKEEKTMKKYTKQWNEGRREIVKGEKWGFCDEWKMWGKEGVCGWSWVEGSVVVANSSMKLNSLGLMERGGESVLRASDGSSVEVSGCVIGVERGIPLFDLRGSCGLFTNISLRSSSASDEQTFPSLFSSKVMEGEISEKCYVSVCSSYFSSFCVSTAPFLSSPSITLISLSKLTFFNISTANDACPSPTASFPHTSCLMSSCSFSSVCDVYDGGIAPSLNNPFTSLTVSNTSFVGCCRTRNVAYTGSEGNPSKPERQNQTDNGANSFTWCVWNGSKTTGTNNSISDGVSSGGAIYMYNKESGTLSVKFCSFNDCNACSRGGGVLCYVIYSFKIENSSFNSCSAQNSGGGGMHAYSISTCVRISGCEFQNCKAYSNGGGLFLNSFQVSGSSCIGTENGKGESACVFECLFTSCSLTDRFGGGMCCDNAPSAIKMRSLQFISCNAMSWGGGFLFNPNQEFHPINSIYFYFFIFHDCRCTDATPYGHDVYFEDQYNLFSSNNPFYESYTTNTNEKRVCYSFYLSSWTYQQTEKKGWLMDKFFDRFVGVNGDDSNEKCGEYEMLPCKTMGHAVEASVVQLSSTITLLGGRHVSEGTTINVGEKKIIITGNGKTVSVIGTNSLSSTATTLFSLSSGRLEVGHVGIDHNATRSPSPSVFVVSVGSGALSLEDVVIDSSTSGGSGISSSMFEVALKQLKTIDVEIENMRISQFLFAEPSSAGSSTGESLLGNLTIRNVNRTTGDGVVMAKSVKGSETFVVWNTTMEECECENGNGGGIKIEFVSSKSKVLIGDSTSHSGGTTTFSQCKCSGCGGGVMMNMADADELFELSGDLIFDGNEAEFGKNMFILGKDFNSSVTNTSFNFDYSEMKDDETLFVGSDNFHSNKDLFMFLIPFSSFEIFISSEGFDVARCGSEEEPCFTMWKGMENMEK